MESIDSESPDKTKWQNLTFVEKLKQFRSNITVEPVVFFFLLPNVLNTFVVQNINLEKACRVNLNYDPIVCDALHDRTGANYTKEDVEVQKLVAGMATLKIILQNLIPCIVVIFWGSWSDRHRRRKPCILFPVIGQFITILGLIACKYFDSVSLEVTVVVESIFVGIAGSWLLFSIGIYSYIADISKEDERTFRIGIVTFVVAVVAELGTAAQILIVLIGYYGTLTFMAVLELIGIFYIIFGLSEVQWEDENNMRVQKNIVLDFFNFEHVLETFRITFKKGKNRRRLRIILTMILMFIVAGPIAGEREVMYLFTRLKFNWTISQYTLFQTYSLLLTVVGNTTVIILFLRIFKLDDALLGAMSSVSKTLSVIVAAFAQTQLQFYIFPVVGFMNGCGYFIVRAVISKIVNRNELAKVNSIIFTCEILSAMVFVTSYSKLYTVTLNTIPGAFFLLGAILTFFGVIIFWWMYQFNKKVIVHLETSSPDIIGETGHQSHNIECDNNNKKNEIKPSYSSTTVQSQEVKKDNGIVNQSFES